MKLTTTFKTLRKHSACVSRYRKLAKHLGDVKSYGENKQIDLLTILESNGFDDCVWSLRATLEKSDSVKRLIAADFAESVLHIFESKRPSDFRPRQAIQAARDFSDGKITVEQMATARRAAVHAAYAAADAAAADASYASYAAYAAAAAAADADAAAYAADAVDTAAGKKYKDEILATILIKHLS